MRLWFFACSVLALGSAACAEGDSIVGAGGSAGEGASSGSGDGGSSSSTKSGPSTGTGQTSSTGTPCEEQPCKLTAPQCGCPETQACTIDTTNERACVEAGSATAGQPCNASTLCEPGTMCVGYQTGLLSCAPFCATDADCTAPGGLCTINLSDGNGGDVPNVTLCSENCNPVTNTGCQVQGTSCQVGLRDMIDPYTLCTPSGAGVQQAACTDSSDCAPGFACLNTAQMTTLCFQWCDVQAANCPGALVCQALEISPGVPLTIGNTTYGACT